LALSLKAESKIDPDFHLSGQWDSAAPYRSVNPLLNRIDRSLIYTRGRALQGSDLFDVAVRGQQSIQNHCPLLASVPGIFWVVGRDFFYQICGLSFAWRHLQCRRLVLK
jgi:hypothetical protein